MSILVHCTCGLSIPVPEAFAGELGECPSCGLRFALPTEFRELGRPVQPGDCLPDRTLSLVCTSCQNRMEIPLKFTGKTIRCGKCRAQQTVPTLVIPQSNLVGAEDAEFAIDACPRCKGPIHDGDAFCRSCGAHPGTGLTHPEAHSIWEAYQRGDLQRASRLAQEILNSTHPSGPEASDSTHGGISGIRGGVGGTSGRGRLAKLRNRSGKGPPSAGKDERTRSGRTQRSKRRSRRPGNSRRGDE